MPGFAWIPQAAAAGALLLRTFSARQSRQCRQPEAHVEHPLASPTVLLTFFQCQWRPLRVTSAQLRLLLKATCVAEDLRLAPHYLLTFLQNHFRVKQEVKRAEG